MSPIYFQGIIWSHHISGMCPEPSLLIRDRNSYMLITRDLISTHGNNYLISHRHYVHSEVNDMVTQTVRKLLRTRLRSEIITMHTCI